MKDFNDVVDAVRQLNQIWKEYTDGLDNKNLPSDIYDRLCDIDESVGSLTGKVGRCNILIIS